jgi:beta-phosphoglucomutase
MKLYKAFLFDLNGTMIDDMSYHIEAWHKLLNDMGAGISLEETKLQCYGKNHEILERIFPGRFSEEEKRQISVAKETRYQKEYRPFLKLINGLDTFLERAYRGNIKMAIGTAAIMMNVDFVVEGLKLQKYFDVMVCADDVARSKPDPETYLTCAEKLNMIPGDCLVFEDSPKGTEAALYAGMDCVVITSMHNPDEFNPVNIARFVPDYTSLFELINHSPQTA